jgi:hypothetical protein
MNEVKFDFESVRRSDPLEQLKSTFTKHKKCSIQTQRLQKAVDATNSMIDKRFATFEAATFDSDMEKAEAERKVYNAVREDMNYLVALENALALASIAEVLYEIKHDLYNRS